MEIRNKHNTIYQSLMYDIETFWGYYTYKLAGD